MNTCYKHPDRETGVSCQRCDRYICPQCSTAGAVGYFCPEDSRDKVKIQRPTFRKSSSERAPITMILIAINIAVFVAQILFPGFTEVLLYFNVGPTSEYGSALRALTSGFAHSPYQYTHVLFNMYSLFVLGTLLEPILGKIKFLLVYFLSIFGGIAAVIMFNEYGYAVYGASGAVFGLMSSYFVMLKVLRVDARQMLAIIGLNLVLSLLPGIAWAAHIGGLIVGAAVTGCLLIFARPKLRLLGIFGIGCIAAFLFSFYF